MPVFSPMHMEKVRIQSCFSSTSPTDHLRKKSNHVKSGQTLREIKVNPVFINRILEIIIFKRRLGLAVIFETKRN